jgi:hypothetical protein
LLSFPAPPSWPTSKHETYLFPGHKKTCSARWNDHPPQNPGMADKRDAHWLCSLKRWQKNYIPMAKQKQGSNSH